MARRFIQYRYDWLLLVHHKNQFGARIYVVSYPLFLFTNRRVSFGCMIYLVSFGFLWVNGVCKSWKRVCKSQVVYLPAHLTWFLVVSYGPPVLPPHAILSTLLIHLFAGGQAMLTNHEKSLCLRILPGFLWFPMAYRFLHCMRNSICPHAWLAMPWPIIAYKSQEVNLVARFTWFLMVSYGLPVVTLHQKLGMHLWCTCLDMAYPCL